MDINRRQPKPDEDPALFLSGVVNDAIEDAFKAGLATREAIRIVRQTADHYDVLAMPTPGGERQ